MDVSGFQVLVLIFCVFSMGVSILVFLWVMKVLEVVVEMDKGLNILLDVIQVQLEEHVEKRKKGNENFGGIEYEKGVN